VDELLSLSDGGSVPLLLQDWDPAGEGFPLDLIARIANEVESLVGLKVEVVPAGPKLTAIRERFGNRFHLSGGWTVLQLIEALDRGVDAFMPTALHEIYTALDKRYRAGDRSGAVELFREVLPVLAFSNQHLNTSIHFFKHLLHAEAVYTSARCRVSAQQFDRYHRRVADELIGYAIELTKKVTTGNG
jgi:4-hydroxy-tetrahydrodipicolinate synthase